MDLNAKVDVNCGRKDSWTVGLTDGRKTGRLYRTLLMQLRQKCTFFVKIANNIAPGYQID